MFGVICIIFSFNHSAAIQCVQIFKHSSDNSQANQRLHVHTVYSNPVMTFKKRNNSQIIMLVWLFHTELKYFNNPLYLLWKITIPIVIWKTISFYSFNYMYTIIIFIKIIPVFL